MKRYLGLSLFAFAVLSFAAVWLGGLNQDEGWGLYAASLVADGKVPYLDFFYTQGPVTAYVYAALSPLWEPFGLVGGRIATWLMGAAARGPRRRMPSRAPGCRRSRDTEPDRKSVV